MSRNQLKLIESSELAPELLHMEVTSQCNMRCPQCYNGFSGNHLDFQFLKQTVLDASQVGIKTVAISGGEPLLYPHLEQAISLVKKNGMNCIMATGGRGLTASMADTLIQSGLDIFHISLNGSRSEIHSLSRDGFEETLKALGLLCQKGAKCQINWVARNDNIYDFGRLMKLCGKYGIDGMNVLKLKPDLDCKVFNELNRNQLIDLANEIEELIEWGWNVQIESCFSQLRNLLDMNAPGFEAGCLAGTKIIALNAEGHFMPCRHLSGYSRGNTDLNSYWNGYLPLKGFQKMIPPAKSLCLTCVHKSTCRPCKAIGEKVYGDIELGEADCCMYQNLKGAKGYIDSGVITKHLHTYFNSQEQNSENSNFTCHR